MLSGLVACLFDGVERPLRAILPAESRRSYVHVRHGVGHERWTICEKAFCVSPCVNSMKAAPCEALCEGAPEECASGAGGPSLSRPHDDRSRTDPLSPRQSRRPPHGAIRGAIVTLKKPGDQRGTRGHHRRYRRLSGTLPASGLPRSHGGKAVALEARFVA
jgi:hypothetical protein